MMTYPLSFGSQDILPLAVLTLFSLCFIFQMYYMWFYFRRLAFYKPDDNSLIEHPVSVVVCARNEYYHLKQHLPQLLTQDYPIFEVIVVNDSSDDPTLEFLEEMKNKYGNLRVFNLEKNLNFFQGKKFPLALGIKSAVYDIILLTDADCKPSSTQWIRKMQSGFTRTTEVVLGYGGYIKEKGLLNLLIRFETLHTAMQYLSFALAGKPYMGVGRNLSYRKDLFYQQKGFSAHYALHSGDDDLFINSVARRENTRIEISKESHTLSPAKRSWAAWLTQKRRHLTTGAYYKSSSRRSLAIYQASKIGMFILAVVLFVRWENPTITAGLVIVYFTTLTVMVFFSGRKLNETNLVLIAPFFDILLMLIMPLVYLSNFIKRPDRWK